MTPEEAEKVVRALAKRYGPWSIVKAGFWCNYIDDLDYDLAVAGAKAWIKKHPKLEPLPGDIRAEAVNLKPTQQDFFVAPTTASPKRRGKRA